jgi:dTDP-4-dehydrorhamnose 3,5-epimerase and related enzymes
LLLLKERTVIKDVKLVDLVANVDDRGYLIEILRSTDEHFTKFGQVYIVGDHARNTVRAFHVHKVLWDWFFMSHGSAKFALVDGRKGSATNNETNTFVLTDRKPQLLVIPPGVLEDDTQMLSTASEVYNKANPDEERVPYDSFGYDWSIKFK